MRFAYRRPMDYELRAIKISVKTNTYGVLVPDPVFALSSTTPLLQDRLRSRFIPGVSTYSVVQFCGATSQAVEKQMFEEDFQKVTPALKELLPTASAEEMQAVKKEIDRLSHTKELHDKPLDYIAWKHKDTLTALVSPKKRGLESV